MFVVVVRIRSFVISSKYMCICTFAYVLVNSWVSLDWDLRRGEIIISSRRSPSFVVIRWGTCVYLFFFCVYICVLGYTLRFVGRRRGMVI